MIDVRSEITAWCHVVITVFEMWIHFNILLVYTSPRKNWKLNTSNPFSHSCYVFLYFPPAFLLNRILHICKTHKSVLSLFLQVTLLQVNFSPFHL